MLHHWRSAISTRKLLGTTDSFMWLSKKTFYTVCHMLLGLLLFNTLAFASQACVVPSHASAIEVLSDHPCDVTDDDDVCLAEVVECDEAVDSRPATFASAPATAVLTIPKAPDKLPVREIAAWSLTIGPPTPIRQQICRLLR